jgi:DNA-binding response OmpR family regulator
VEKDSRSPIPGRSVSLRLLVIEDEDRLSGILKSKLSDIGFTVDIAGSATDASAALELINYDAASSILACPMVTGSPF